MKNTIQNLFLKLLYQVCFTEWHTQCSMHSLYECLCVPTTTILSRVFLYSKCHHVTLGTRRYVCTECPFILSVCVYHTLYSIVPSVLYRAAMLGRDGRYH
jgi:hypothetical protein